MDTCEAFPNLTGKAFSRKKDCCKNYRTWDNDLKETSTRTLNFWNIYEPLGCPMSSWYRGKWIKNQPYIVVGWMRPQKIWWSWFQLTIRIFESITSSRTRWLHPGCEGWWSHQGWDEPFLLQRIPTTKPTHLPQASILGVWEKSKVFQVSISFSIYPWTLIFDHGNLFLNPSLSTILGILVGGY